MATRKKPKKADFVHNKKRYWFSDYFIRNVSYSVDPIGYFIEPIVLDYETNQAPLYTLWEDIEFLKKVTDGSRRVLPHAGSPLAREENY